MVNKDYFKEYYAKNKDKYKESNKKYRQSIKGKKTIKEYEQSPKMKKWRKEYDKKRYTPENKIYRTINKQIRRCITNIAKNNKYHIYDITDYRYKTLYGIDLHKIIDHLKPIPKDIENYDLDHVIPITEFNLNKKNDIQKAYDPKNLQLLKRRENKIKSNN